MSEGRKAAGSKVLSKPFIALIGIVGFLGVTVPAFAAYGSTGYVIYYGKYGPDGVIHCAGYNAAVDTNPGTVSSDTLTYVAKNLYCGSADSYPANYFAADTQLYNNNLQLCYDPGWQWNTNGASSVNTGFGMAEGSCPTSQYITLGQNYAAVNLAWQYWSETSPWEASA